MNVIYLDFVKSMKTISMPQRKKIKLFALR